MDRRRDPGELVIQRRRCLSSVVAHALACRGGIHATILLGRRDQSRRCTLKCARKALLPGSLALAKSLPCIFNKLRSPSPASAAPCSIFDAAWTPGPARRRKFAKSRRPETMSLSDRSGPPEWCEIPWTQTPRARPPCRSTPSSTAATPPTQSFSRMKDAAAFEDLVADYVRRIQPADPVEYH